MTPTVFDLGVDGVDYNITSTTQRILTTYGSYGLASSFEQVLTDDTTGQDINVVTTVTRTFGDYDIKGRSLDFF